VLSGKGRAFVGEVATVVVVAAAEEVMAAAAVEEEAEVVVRPAAGPSANAWSTSYLENASATTEENALSLTGISKGLAV
jgi:hypothetical protein